MLKLILCIATICFGGFIGFYFASKFKNRVLELNQCELMLTKIKVYIKAENIKTNELIDRLCNSESLNRLAFLQACRDKLECDKNFPVVWKESLSEVASTMALKKDDLTELMQLSEVIGSCDSRGVQTTVEVMQSEIALSIENAVLESKTTGQLCTRLGFLGALAVAIIFI